MLLSLLACVPVEGEAPKGEELVTDLQVTLAEVPTVLWVRWTTAEPSRAVVQGTFGADVIVVEEREAVTDHEVLLAGFPARTDVAVEVLLEGAEPATAAITTGALPTWVPDLTYTADVPELAAGGFVLAGVISLDEGGVVALDHAGRPVWAHTRIAESEGSVYRARMSLDGNAILYAGGASAADTYGLFVRVPLDGSGVTTTPGLGTHTDFVELPSGGYAALGWELRDYDGRTIVGDTIVEVGLDGTSHVVWSAFDDFSPNLDHEHPHWYSADPDAEDWTHINGIAYDAAEDALYVTMTFNNSVARVDRGTGTLAWWLADAAGDFTRVGDGELVSQPHSVQRTPEGLLVFNRGNPADADTCSNATDIALDEALGTAEQLDVYTSERCLLIPFLGSAQRLPGGNTLVSWTSAGQMDEVTPDGELAWRVNTSAGFAFGFAEEVATLGDGAP
ncbi:MAG: aryl-sulfate sulfotransferase [Myxococcota bacterium]